MNISGYAFIVGGGTFDCLSVYPKLRHIWAIRNSQENLNGLGDGIGKACALAFAEEGAAGILIADINLDTAKEVAELCKTKSTTPHFSVEAIQVDVAVEESVKVAASRMTALFPRIDYCVNCAGVSADDTIYTSRRLTACLSWGTISRLE